MQLHNQHTTKYLFISCLVFCITLFLGNSGVSAQSNQQATTSFFEVSGKQVSPDTILWTATINPEQLKTSDAYGYGFQMDIQLSPSQEFISNGFKLHGQNVKPSEIQRITTSELSVRGANHVISGQKVTFVYMTRVINKAAFLHEGNHTRGLIAYYPNGAPYLLNSTMNITSTPTLEKEADFDNSDNKAEIDDVKQPEVENQNKPEVNGQDQSHDDKQDNSDNQQDNKAEIDDLKQPEAENQNKPEVNGQGQSHDEKQDNSDNQQDNKAEIDDIKQPEAENQNKPEINDQDQSHDDKQDNSDNQQDNNSEIDDVKQPELENQSKLADTNKKRSVLGNHKQSVVLDENNYKLNHINTNKQTKLPKTGSNSRVELTIIGLLILVILISFTVYTQKHHR